MTNATQSLATLGHPGRLTVFRLLMRLAPQGVRPTEIAQTLQIKPNTLSHHLAELERCGLIRAERQGRSIFYAVDLDRTGAFLGYLINDCCRARPDLTEALQMEPAMPPYNVLFLCTGNSARSVLAEAILNREGKGMFIGHSAGSRPKSSIHPFTADLLRRLDYDINGFRSKSWDEFALPGAPPLHFVFTVCDQAAAEECPYWPGQPVSAHWGLPDPAAAAGNEAERRLAFSEAYRLLHRRISAFVSLPVETLDRLSLQKHLDQIGQSGATP